MSGLSARLVDLGNGLGHLACLTALPGAGKSVKPEIILVLENDEKMLPCSERFANLVGESILKLGLGGDFVVHLIFVAAQSGFSTSADLLTKLTLGDGWITCMPYVFYKLAGVIASIPCDRPVLIFKVSGGYYYREHASDIKAAAVAASAKAHVGRIAPIKVVVVHHEELLKNADDGFSACFGLFSSGPLELWNLSHENYGMLGSMLDECVQRFACASWCKFQCAGVARMPGLPPLDSLLVSAGCDTFALIPEHSVLAEVQVAGLETISADIYGFLDFAYSVLRALAVARDTKRLSEALDWFDHLYVSFQSVEAPALSAFQARIEGLLGKIDPCENLFLRIKGLRGSEDIRLLPLGEINRFLEGKVLPAFVDCYSEYWYKLKVSRKDCRDAVDRLADVSAGLPRLLDAASLANVLRMKFGYGVPLETIIKAYGLWVEGPVVSIKTGPRYDPWRIIVSHVGPVATQADVPEADIKSSTLSVVACTDMELIGKIHEVFVSYHLRGCYDPDPPAYLAFLSATAIHVICERLAEHFVWVRQNAMQTIRSIMTRDNMKDLNDIVRVLGLNDPRRGLYERRNLISPSEALSVLCFSEACECYRFSPETFWPCLLTVYELAVDEFYVSSSWERFFNDYDSRQREFSRLLGTELPDGIDEEFIPGSFDLLKALKAAEETPWLPDINKFVRVAEFLGIPAAPGIDFKLIPLVSAVSAILYSENREITSPPLWGLSYDLVKFLEGLAEKDYRLAFERHLQALRAERLVQILVPAGLPEFIELLHRVGDRYSQAYRALKEALLDQKTSVRDRIEKCWVLILGRDLNGVPVCFNGEPSMDNYTRFARLFNETDSGKALWARLMEIRASNSGFKCYRGGWSTINRRGHGEHRPSFFALSYGKCRTASEYFVIVGPEEEEVYKQIHKDCCGLHYTKKTADVKASLRRKKLTDL